MNEWFFWFSLLTIVLPFVLAEASDCELDEYPEDDTIITEKDTNLRSALSQLSVSGVFDQDSKLWLQRFSRTRRVSVISTGSLNLDLALGVGGLPKGRMVEVYGKEASGKTTLALHIIKEAQKLGGYCAYLDVENAMDPTLAESIGVNTEELLISRPDSAENMLSIVDVLTKCGSVDVIVVDSVSFFSFFSSQTLFVLLIEVGIHTGCCSCPSV